MRYNKARVNREILGLGPSSWFDGMSQTSFLYDIDGHIYRWNNKVSGEYFSYVNGTRHDFEYNQLALNSIFCNESVVNTNYIHYGSQQYYGDRTILVCVFNFYTQGFSIPGAGLTIIYPGLVDITLNGERYSISHGIVYNGADPQYPGMGVPMGYKIDHVYPDSFSQVPHNNPTGSFYPYLSSYKLFAPYTMFSVCFVNIARDGGVSFSFNMAQDRISFGPRLQYNTDGQWPPCPGEGDVDNKVLFSSIFGNVLYGTKRMASGGISDLLVFDRSLSQDERDYLFALVRTKASPQFFPEVLSGYGSASRPFISHTINGESLTVINDVTVELAEKITGKTDPTLILVDEKRIGKI